MPVLPLSFILIPLRIPGGKIQYIRDLEQLAKLGRLPAPWAQKAFHTIAWASREGFTGHDIFQGPIRTGPISPAEHISVEGIPE